MELAERLVIGRDSKGRFPGPSRGRQADYELSVTVASELPSVLFTTLIWPRLLA